MDPEKEREIIRLWNLLRLLEREGRPVAIVRRQIEKALAERGQSCSLTISGRRSNECGSRSIVNAGDIRKLQQAGISTASADALLERMLNRIDWLCAERDRLKKEQAPVKGKALGGRS
jgi:hypothetical protein